MENKKDKESLHFFFWGIGVLGLLWILSCIVEVARFLVLKKLILWDRVIILLLMGIGLYLLGRKYTKRFG